MRWNISGKGNRYISKYTVNECCGTGRFISDPDPIPFSFSFCAYILEHNNFLKLAI
jgi:hypothetical protein